MIKLLLTWAVAVSVSMGIDVAPLNAEPPSIPPEIAQITQRFFEAIKQDSAKEYGTIAPLVEISYSDSDDNKMSLDQAREQFPDCVLAAITSSEKVGDEQGGLPQTYTFNGTLTCTTGSKVRQIVGIMADRNMVYMVRPGGFEDAKETPAEKTKVEKGAQEAIEWLTSFRLQVPAGPFKSWPKKEQETLPRLVQNTCTYIWTMMHDSGRLFPKEISEQDEWSLGLDLCVAGHMPADWPERDVRLKAARAALQRITTAGSAVRMPTTIAQ